MYKAIKNNVLVNTIIILFLYPHEDELKNINLTVKDLMNMMQKPEDLQIMELNYSDRKRVIHKAKDKLKKLEELLSVNKNLNIYSYMFMKRG